MHGQRHAEHRHLLAARRIVDPRDVLGELRPFRNAVTGTASLVSLSTIIAMPMPQLGWQPQESWPHSAAGPCARSAQSPNVPMNEIGNQSRVGSPMPVWFFTSCARCDSV